MKRKLFRPKRFLKSLVMGTVGATAFLTVIMGAAWGLANLIMLLAPNPIIGLPIFALATLSLILTVTLYADPNIK